MTLDKIRKDLDRVASEAKIAGKDATQAVMDQLQGVVDFLKLSQNDSGDQSSATTAKDQQKPAHPV